METSHSHPTRASSPPPIIDDGLIPVPECSTLEVLHGPHRPYNAWKYSQPEDEAGAQVWSNLQSRNATRPPGQTAWTRRRMTWVIVGCILLFASLAGIMGAILTGGINISGGGDGGEDNQTTTGLVATVETSSASATTGTGPGGTTTRATATSSNTRTTSSRPLAASSSSSLSTPGPPPPSTTTTRIETTLPPSSSTSPSPTQTKSPNTASPPPNGTGDCPIVDGQNYTSPVTKKVFKRGCGVNYWGGDAKYGSPVEGRTFAHITECMDLCAAHSDCVGAVFNGGHMCWLKKYLGKKKVYDWAEAYGTESGVLWQ